MAIDQEPKKDQLKRYEVVREGRVYERCFNVLDAKDRARSLSMQNAGHPYSIRYDGADLFEFVNGKEA
ncbi:MAG TPA: hypothetical protein PLP20_06070 [Oscillospiraceae bacterium]|nr:hypothetical protein [Oscillospiraceae bacterium]HNW04189.1 hypothetical protein [Oscillospiraceae bacterium]HPW00604.1 hypothetical protein [Oscillospiraceae bacterium]